MEIAPSKANDPNQQGTTQSIVSVQWDQKSVKTMELNTGRVFSDGKKSCRERIPKPCSA